MSDAPAVTEDAVVNTEGLGGGNGEAAAATQTGSKENMDSLRLERRFIWASGRGRVKEVTDSLERGMPVDVKNWVCRIALYTPTCLIATACFQWGSTALHIASQYGQLSIAEILLKAGANVNLAGNVHFFVLPKPTSL